MLAEDECFSSYTYFSSKHWCKQAHLPHLQDHIKEILGIVEQ
uniref:Uncharacterized protein n=1 Tax=Manihot esculenta TaxID=3983 RepID=A0A2C9UNH2_MANES